MKCKQGLTPVLTFVINVLRMMVWPIIVAGIFAKLV
jgi:hypothetical protein